MTRHQFGLPMMVALLLLSPCATLRAETQPNVIIIYADDLGYGDLGCYGHPEFKTPHLDRMAAEGARLTNFYSCCPYCAPSRTGLQTGRYQFRSGMFGNPAPDGGPAADKIGLPDSEVTLGEAFQAAGYRTICVGKWHLGHHPQFRPLKHGYDEYLGILYSNDMRPVELIDGDEVIEYPVVQARLTKRYTERALKFIADNRDRPFFLYLPHAMPHKPLAASEEFYKQSGAGLYADVIAELDWSVGQVFAQLEKLQLDERTLVLFTSDNGPWYGGSTGGLRGMKSETMDGGIRVPLLARWPGRIPAGHVSRELASIIDLLPTVLTAAGIDLPQVDVLDGRDIMPLLTSSAASPHEAIFSLRNTQLATVRSGPWKLHVGPSRVPKNWARDETWIDPRGPDGVTILAPHEQYHPADYPGVLTGDTWQKSALFNLDDDPSEQHNVADRYPEVAGRLRRLYDAMEIEVQAARRKFGQ
jgi:arylsulfatase A-like enzyme